MSSGTVITKLDSDDEAAARGMLLSLVSLQPQGEALFSDRLPMRRLGYPFFQHDLTRDQWSRLVGVALRMDVRPSGFLMGSVAPVRAFDTVFRVDIDSAYPYPEMISLGWPSIYDSVVCDEQGTWAIIVNSEDSAILGAANSETLSALGGALAEFSDSGLANLFGHWKEELSNASDRAKLTGWIEWNLRHAYSNAAGLLIASLDD